MEMSQVRYFIAVSETLNFTRAARRCGVSQPALTKAIQKLELAIGGELLKRERNSVQLTELGYQLLPNFKDVLKNANHTREEAFRLLRAPTQVVKVGVAASISLRKVMDLVEPVRQAMPYLEIEFFELTALNNLKQIQSLDLDVLFSSHHTYGDEQQKHSLLSEDYVIAFGHHHRFLGRSTVTLEDLDGEKFFFRDQCDSSALLHDRMLCQGLHLHVNCRSSQDGWIKMQLENYPNIVFVPRSVAFAEGLVFASLEDFSLKRHLVLQRCEKATENIQLSRFMQAMIGESEQSYEVA